MNGPTPAPRDGNAVVLDQIVGPFYDADGVIRYLALREGELAQQITANEIIWAALADGTWVFPTWQFHIETGVRIGLLRVWQTLRRAADPWTAALWMCAPATDLDGLTAVAYLVAGATEARLDAVTMIADRDTERWLH